MAKHSLKGAAIDVVWLAAYAGLYAAWKFGSEGAGNLFVFVLWVQFAIGLVGLLAAGHLAPRQPPTGALRGFRIVRRCCWVVLACVMVWHGHFVLSIALLLLLSFGVVLAKHLEGKWEAAHG